MRNPIIGQEKLNKFWAFTLNDCFTNYIEDLIKNYTNNKNYNIYEDQIDDFIIPGRLELCIDGHKAYIELSSDVLLAIYQIVVIKNDTMNSRLMEGENVDLREYRKC